MVCAFTGKHVVVCLLVLERSEPTNIADQMAEWYRASASGSVDLKFDSESGQINDLKIGIRSFPA